MIRWVVLGILLGLQSCNIVNDYWLGKDNTPKPSTLKPVTEKAKFTERWSVPVGHSSAKAAFIRLKPAVHGDQIYVATHDGSVNAINTANGHVIWSKKLNKKLVSGPSVEEGIVVVSTDNASIIALSQKTGKKLWEGSTSGEVQSTPLITNNHVEVKTVDGRLYAFNAKNGEKTWVVDHGSPNFVLRASSSPVRYNQMVLAGFSDGKLDAIDLHTGHVAWQRSMGYVGSSSDVDRLLDISTDPLVREHTVYLASYQGYLVAMSLRQGEFLWTKPVSTYRNLGIDGSRLYMTDTQDILWAIDRANGKVQWKQPALAARHLTAPIVMGRYLVAGDKLGVLHLFDKHHGEVVGRHSIGGGIVASPVIDSSNPNHLYILTAKGELHGLSVTEVLHS